MSAQGQAPANLPIPCLARQPILAKDEKVFGYELLYRENHEDPRFTSDPDSATRITIDTLNLIGFDAVCDGHLAFINGTNQMLSQEFFLLLPSDKVVVQLGDTVTASEEVIAACRVLKEMKYRIALASYVLNDPREPLVPFADFIKVDVQKSASEQRAAIVVKHSSPHCQMVAHKVETRQQQVTTAKEGFTLFQGYFFRSPERMRARHIEGTRASYLRLLQAISASVVDFFVVEDLIKHDPSMCYRLLRYLNSPLLGMSRPVQSVRNAMNLLGERELVRWIRMATTLMFGQDKCSDLVLSALVRARFCELIAPKVDRSKSDLFLVGMLSLMDAILEIPMGIVVEGLALDEDTKAELLGAKKGSNTPLTPIYRLMLAREIGEWEDVTTLAKLLNLSLPFVNRAYNEAMAWAREMTSGQAPEVPA
jgi:EAL and modified HD-GYP domain-containing signal transduction protein